ncbi:MAG: YdcF family protein [Lentimicrobiaceae bacterium]|nr:YdcF family protein [Lentimicrobiaceae bacterium]
MKLFKIFFKWLLYLSGGYFLILIILAFTTLPFWVFFYFGTYHSTITQPPDFIVVLGGGGMPSQDGLIRTYHAACLAEKFPESKVIIALPGDMKDSTSAIRLMKREMIIRGVFTERIVCEVKGTNTRSQAIEIAGYLQGKIVKNPITIVTTPEHMIRAIKTFEKAGFSNINGFPAFDKGIEADITFNDTKLGGEKILIPSIGKNLQLRYQFWNHLKFELIITREIFGIAYYKLRGWI